MTQYAPVDHPGTPVPADRRPWTTPWPDYVPVDITPPELRPGSIDTTAHWIHDHQTDPTDVPDMAQRQAAALIPFTCDADGRPLNPGGRTGRTGRNLGRWGENTAADPIVIAGTGASRRILLIQRNDCGQWAIPGGHVDPGETAPAALVRELHEETGVDLRHVPHRVITRTLVDDPRATDHAWIATTAALYQLDHAITPTAGDDASDAHWWPAGSLHALTTALRDAGAQLYPAHQALITTALSALDTPNPALSLEEK